MARMKSAAIKKVKQIVREQFAEFEGVEPKIVEKAAPGDTEACSFPLYVLTFRQQMVLEDGGRIARIVRVTADQEGQIIKMSASR